MKKYLTSLEVSKQLSERGLSLKSDWFWQKLAKKDNFNLSQRRDYYDTIYNAFCLEQLIEIMPAMISGAQFLSVWNDGVGYFENESIICHSLHVSFLNDNNDDSLADCAAKCLIKLHDEKEIDLKTVKPL